MLLLHIYLLVLLEKQNEKGRKQASVCWFTRQMAVMTAEAARWWTQNPLRSPHQCQGLRDTGHRALLSLMQQVGIQLAFWYRLLRSQTGLPCATVVVPACSETWLKKDNADIPYTLFWTFNDLSNAKPGIFSTGMLILYSREHEFFIFAFQTPVVPSIEQMSEK